MMQLRQKAVAFLQKNDARGLIPQLWIESANRLHQVRNVPRHLHTAKATANDDNSEQPLARLPFGLSYGGFEVADQIVAHDNRIGDRFQQIGRAPTRWRA